MKKLVVLYRTPEDAEAFMRYYREKHLPLARAIPGLVRIEIAEINRTLVGEPGNFLLAELYFETEEAFAAAMKSPEFAATGADLGNFAKGLATVMIGKVTEL
jgi:uncharacterized protein (TIGR02118 family)